MGKTLSVQITRRSIQILAIVTVLLLGACEPADPNVQFVDGINDRDYPTVKRAMDRGATLDLGKRMPPFTSALFLAVGTTGGEPEYEQLQLGHQFREPENIALIKLLLDAGADPNFRDMDGRTPLMGAAYHHQLGTIWLLLSYGADPSVKDRRGNTAYYWADAAKADDGIRLMKLCEQINCSRSSGSSSPDTQ